MIRMRQQLTRISGNVTLKEVAFDRQHLIDGNAWMAQNGSEKIEAGCSTASLTAQHFGRR
jgi:cytoskeletal protein CcmA (bactofilin family)